MKKIVFTKIGSNNDLSVAKPVNDKYILLSFFLESNRNINFLQTDVIKRLESILKENKTFEDIQSGYANWTFADDYCEFEVENTTAYFTNYNDKSQNLEMPLKELIDYLYDWKEFLQS